MELLKVFEIPGVLVKVPTIWLLENSMMNNYYNIHLILRYLTAREYLLREDRNWMDYYNRMQKKRVETNPMVPREKADNEYAFIALIESMKSKGFDDKSAILVNNNMRLVDGSHRLAIALLLNIEYVPIVITENSYFVDSEYSVKWFVNNGFENIVNELIEVYNSIRKEK